MKERKYVPLTVSVPEDEKDNLKMLIYELIYAKDDATKVVVKIILANPDKTAGEIRWILERDHAKKASPTRIASIAKRIGVSLKKKG